MFLGNLDSGPPEAGPPHGPAQSRTKPARSGSLGAGLSGSLGAGSSGSLGGGRRPGAGARAARSRTEPHETCTLGLARAPGLGSGPPRRDGSEGGAQGPPGRTGPHRRERNPHARVRSAPGHPSSDPLEGKSRVVSPQGGDLKAPPTPRNNCFASRDRPGIQLAGPAVVGRAGRDANRATPIPGCSDVLDGRPTPDLPSPTGAPGGGGGAARARHESPDRAPGGGR